MTEEETKPNVDRTSAGLRNALFDELDALRNNKTNATKANATAKLAASIISTVELEMEVSKTLAKMPDGSPKTLSLPSVALAGTNG